MSQEIGQEEEEWMDIGRQVPSSSSGLRTRNTKSLRSKARLSKDGVVIKLTVVAKRGKSPRGVACRKGNERLQSRIEKKKSHVLSNVSIKLVFPIVGERESKDVELGPQPIEDSKLEEEEELREEDLIFTPLDKITINKRVNLIGVIHEVSPVDRVMTERNQEVSRRHVTIVDKSRYSVWMTIWDKQAENFAGVPGDVVMTKKAHISNYAGKAASAKREVFINPDIEEARELKAWYESSGRDTNFKLLSKLKERLAEMQGPSGA